MDDDEFRLLKTLREKEKMNYRSIIIEMSERRGADLHPKTARIMLDRLIKRGLIKEEGRTDWKRGKKLWYSLTEKGKTKLMNEALERISESLKIVEGLTSRLLEEKSKLEDWRRVASDAVLNVHISENMPLEERVRRIEDEAKRTFGLLTKAYKNMHRLMCEVFLWKLKKLDPEHFDPTKFFIGFHKYGGIYFIPAALLKEQEWRGGLL